MDGSSPESKGNMKSSEYWGRTVANWQPAQIQLARSFLRRATDPSLPIERQLSQPQRQQQAEELSKSKADLMRLGPDEKDPKKLAEAKSVQFGVFLMAKSDEELKAMVEAIDSLAKKQAAK